MLTRRKTQEAIILELLIRACGEWVPLPQILAIAAQYNARLYALRRVGYRIENRTELAGGRRLSWFRLVLQPGGAAPQEGFQSPPSLFENPNPPLFEFSVTSECSREELARQRKRACR